MAPSRKAHDIHTICPWCGAEKSSACEFEAGFCPWEGPAEAVAAPVVLPLTRAVWPWQCSAEDTIVEEIAGS